MSHQVIVPLVVATQEDGSALYLYQGAPVPSSLPDAEVKRLKDGGFIGKVAKTDAGEESEPYKGVNVADLKSEIEKRNEGREDDKKIVPAEPGNRPELVAALVADDEAQAK